MAKSYPDVIPEAYKAHEDLESAYLKGWSQGQGLACHNVPTLGKTYWLDSEGKLTADVDNIRDVHQALCFAGADNSRQYSPFEFTAREFNSRRSEYSIPDGSDDDTVSSEAMWEAFETGTADAIFADLAEYDDESYGIEPDEDEGPTYGDRLADWKYAVANDDTQLGFADWLMHQKEAEA